MSSVQTYIFTTDINKLFDDVSPQLDYNAVCSIRCGLSKWAEEWMMMMTQINQYVCARVYVCVCTRVQIDNHTQTTGATGAARAGLWSVLTDL